MKYFWSFKLVSGFTCYDYFSKHLQNCYDNSFDDVIDAYAGIAPVLWKVAQLNGTIETYGTGHLIITIDNKELELIMKCRGTI